MVVEGCSNGNQRSRSASGSRKRKQPDQDEATIRDGILGELPIENEYEHFDDDDDEVEDEETINRKEAEYEQILTAQEPATLTQCGDIKITPFNLEEELEDGEFDASGSFLFNKNKKTDDEEHDNWAESVDWEAVEKKTRADEGNKKPNQASQPVHSKDEEPAVRDKVTSYKMLLRIMRDGETVQKTIRRLGNAVPKRKPIKANSKTKASETLQDSACNEENRKNLNLMIEIAHQLLENGDMDIYQKSYEDLEEAIN